MPTRNMNLGLREKYKKEGIAYLKDKLGLKNELALPKISKITVSVGFGKTAVGKTLNERKELAGYIGNSLALITGQKPKIARAKKSIAAFKLRQGLEVGCFCTLRGKRMYQFLEKLIALVLPRQRDFKGIRTKSISDQGDLTIGFKEFAPFPELKIEREKGIFGLEVTVSTTAKNKEQGQALFKALGAPFEKK